MKNTKIKKILYSIFPRYTRTKLYWFIQTLLFLKNWNKFTPRTIHEYNHAKNFRLFWEKMNTAEQNTTRENLIKNLSTESIQEVDSFINRQVYISENNILELGKLFTKKEIQEQKECSKIIHKISKKLSQFNFPVFNSECFYGMSGLRWVPSSVIEKIKNGIFLDVGACEGDTAVFFAMNFLPRKIYAFEPENKNFTILKANAEIYDKKVIIPINVGLSDTASKTRITSNGGGSHISESTSDQEIELVNFDESKTQLNITEKISFIKMDIEGMEQYALKGLTKTIQTDKPFLAISLYHNAEDFFFIKPWLETLVPEYTFMIRKASPFALTGETMLLAYIQ